jgi:hypothetical protein
MSLSMVLTALLAQAPTQERAGPPNIVDAHQDAVARLARPECMRPASRDEIVVCGTSEAEQAYRYRVDPTWDSTVRASQWGAGQVGAMDAGTGSCSAVGPNQRCGGGLNALAIGRVLVRGLGRLLSRD